VTLVPTGRVTAKAQSSRPAAEGVGYRLRRNAVTPHLPRQVTAMDEKESSAALAAGLGWLLHL
jgi:hypothetical protein